MTPSETSSEKKLLSIVIREILQCHIAVSSIYKDVILTFLICQQFDNSKKVERDLTQIS
jgi:hypothetical protein